MGKSGSEGQWGGVQTGFKGTISALRGGGGAHHWCQVSLLFPRGLGLDHRLFLFAGHARKLQSV